MIQCKFRKQSVHGELIVWSADVCIAFQRRMQDLPTGRSMPSGEPPAGSGGAKPPKAESPLSIFIQKRGQKCNDLSDSLPPCPRQTASRSHNPPPIYFWSMGAARSESDHSLIRSWCYHAFHHVLWLQELTFSSKSWDASDQWFSIKNMTNKTLCNTYSYTSYVYTPCLKKNCASVIFE